MGRHTFGWSLPPGVTDRMIDEAAGGDEDTSPENTAYELGWKHGYEAGLQDAEQMLLTKQRTVQAYGMDCEVIQIDEALDAIHDLARAKP